MTMKMKSRDDSRRCFTLESSISFRQFRATAWLESDKRRLLTEDLALKKARNQICNARKRRKVSIPNVVYCPTDHKKQERLQKIKTLQRRGLYLTHPFALTLKSRKGGIAL